MFFTFLSRKQSLSLFQEGNTAECQEQLQPADCYSTPSTKHGYGNIFFYIICNICSIYEINKLVNPRENLWGLVPMAYGIWKEMNKAFEWKPIA